MSKLIIKVKRSLPYDELERIEESIKHDLDKNGFAIIDDNFEIYEIEDKGADE